MKRFLQALFAMLVLSWEMSAEPGKVRGFSFAPPDHCVLNYILFPSPKEWYFDYLHFDENHTFAFYRPKPASDVQIFFRFTDDPTGTRFNEFQKTMRDLAQAGKAEQLDAQVLDEAAAKRDMFFVPKPESEDYVVIYSYPKEKHLVQMIITFQGKFFNPDLNGSERQALRSLVLRFVSEIRRIEVLRTSPN